MMYPQRVVLVLFFSLSLTASVSSGEEADDYTLGVEAYRAGNYVKAVQLFEQVAKKSPDDGVVFYNLGMAYLYTGDNFSAEEKLNNALLLNTDFPEVYYALGSLYLKQERGELARVSYKKACDLGFSKGCLVYKNL